MMADSEDVQDDIGYDGRSLCEEGPIKKPF